MAKGADREVNTKFNVDSGKASGALGSLSKSFSGLGGIMGKVTSMINPMNAAMGAIGAALSIKAISDLGDKFEQTQITMAGFMTSLGISSNYASGFKEAATVMDQIRVAAAALPGEAQDYIEVFKAGLPVVQKAVGGTVSEMTAFTNRYTAIAKTLQVDSGQAARDLTLMLREGKGAAGMDVRTFTQLLPFMKSVEGQADVTRESFNKMTAPKRAQLLNDTFSKLDPMLAKSANSFDAMSGAFKSNSQEMIRLATAPLFEGMKRGLEKINLLFYDEKGALTDIGNIVVNVGKAISSGIVTAIEMASAAVGKLGSAWASFTKSKTFEMFKQVVGSFQGTIGKLGGAVSGIAGVQGDEGGKQDMAVGAIAAFAGMLAGITPMGAIVIGGLAKFAQNTEAVDATMAGLVGIGNILIQALDPVIDVFMLLADMLGDVFIDILPALSDGFHQLFAAVLPLWDGLAALTKTLVIRLKPTVMMLSAKIKNLIQAIVAFLVPVIRSLAVTVMWLANKLADFLMPIIEAVGKALGYMIDAISKFLRWLGKIIGESGKRLGAKGKPGKAKGGSFLDDFLAKMKTADAAPTAVGSGGAGAKGGAGGGARGGGGRAKNDFRFSRFEITQKFAEGFDPDRIAVAFSKDVGRIGETRYQSGFEPLFSIK